MKYQSLLLRLIVICLFLVIPIHSALAAPVRALHVAISTLEAGDLIKLGDAAAAAGFNTMMLDLGNKVSFSKFPGGLLKKTWTPAEFMQIVEHLRSKNIEVIPVIKMLTKQDYFTVLHPDIMFNKQTYNPDNPNVYQLFFPYLEEVISILKPRAIHIGHDELATWNIQSQKWEHVGGEGTLPANLFLKDVQAVNSFLQARGVETWMWGDMLISPEEFPSMMPEYFNGLGAGYNKHLRNQIPKNIVICDWHYFDNQTNFPSLSVFRAEGFQVIGVSWRKEVTTKNFSRYAAQNGARGMITTTWFDPNPNRKEAGVVGSWKEMNQIIQFSGAAFNENFPDAK